MSTKPVSSDVLKFICIVLFLDGMGVGLVIPVMPELIIEISSYSNSEAARISGYLLFAFAIMQFVAAPILGGLSDRYGRRPVLLLALLGFSLNYFVMAGATTLFWLFIARIISGVFGATYPTANACVSDISSPVERARNFGLAGAAFGIGFIFGPAMGGLLGGFSVRLPFIVAGLLMLVACLYGFVAFRETLPAQSRRPFSLGRANPVGSLLAISRYRYVLVLIVSLFFLQLANQSYISIWSFYTVETFKWSPLEIGLSVGVYGAMLALVQGVITGPAVKRFGEVRCATFGLAIGVATYIGLAFSNQIPTLYFWIIIGGLTGLVLPSLQALMTKSVSADAQGELQGAIASSFSISTIIGPLVLSQIFWNFTSGDGLYFPGAAFLGAALLSLLSLGVFVYSSRKDFSTLS